MGSKYIGLAVSLVPVLAIAADSDRLLASASSTTLYGSIEQGIKVGDLNKDDKTRAEYLSDHVRLGIRGEEALNNDLRAFFNFHFSHEEKDGSSGLNGVREAHVGLKGSFGKLTLGRQKTSWKTTVGKAVFDELTPGIERMSKMIRYDLDNIVGSGFHISLDGVLDGSHEVIINGKTRAFNAYDAAAGYQGRNFYAGVGYQRTSVDAIETKLGGKTNELIGASVSYTPYENKDREQSLTLALDYHHHASFGEYFAASADYAFGRQKVRAGWEMLDYDKQKDLNLYHLGYRYYFSPRTYSELKGFYRKHGSDDGYVTKLMLHHDF